MKLSEKQKDLIRKELSGEEKTLLWCIRRDIRERLHAVVLDDEDIEYLRRLEEYFRDPDYVVADWDPEVDSVILDFETDIIWVWRAIRKHIVLYDNDEYDLDFDKTAILKDIDEAVNKYLRKLEEN